MDVMPFDTTTVIRKETIQPLVLTQWLLHLFFRSSIQTYPFGTHHIWSTLPFLFLQSTVFTETISIAQVTMVSLRHLVIFHRFSHRQWNIGQYLFFFYRKLQHWHAWEAFSQQHNDRLLLTSSQLQVWYRWVKSNKAYCSFLQRECSRSVYSISLLSLSLPHASFKMKEDRKPLETTMTSPRRPDWCGWQAGQRKYLM